MKNNTRIFVVDGNWYLNRAWFVLKGSRDFAESLPFVLLGMVAKDACVVKATHVLVAFDGDSNFRKKIYPEYKANRNPEARIKYRPSEDSDDGTEDIEHQIYQYLPETRKYLEAHGIAWMQNKKYEADDVLASAAAQYTDHPLILGAQDKDIYQTLTDNVKMIDSTAKPEPKIITKQSVEKRRGLKISQLIAYQTLIGDGADNVKRYKSEAEAKKILSKHGSIKAWVAQGDKEITKWFRLNQTALLLNKRLVTLVKDIKLPELDTLVMPKLSDPNAPKAWHVYQSFLYPKSKGLFK